MPGHMSARAHGFDRLRPNHLISSKASPATTGMPEDPRYEQPLPVELPERGEHEDGHDHHQEQEAGAAAGMEAGELLGVLRRERLARLVTGDRLVLGAVVLEHALEVAHARDQPEVERGRSRSGSASRSARTTTPLGMSSRKRLVRPAGSRKNRPTANSSANATVPAQAPPPSSFCSPCSSGGIWALAEMPSALKPIFSDSRQRHHAANDGQAQHAVALRPRHERLGGHLDLALGSLLGVRAAVGQLLGRGLAHGHGPRGHAAHHHALEDGLAADRGVAGRLPRRARRGGAVRRRRSAHLTHRIGAPAPNLIGRSLRRVRAT